MQNFRQGWGGAPESARLMANFLKPRGVDCDVFDSGFICSDVGKLAVFAGVHKYPARVKCAILSWHALMSALKGESKPVTTESEQN